MPAYFPPIQALASVAHRWVNAISSAGVATATQPASTDLSDVSVGTWTPTITTSGTAGTPAYSTQVGSYERIGRQVTARFTITLSGWTGSPSGNVSIGGLPVAAANTANDNGVCAIVFYAITSTPGGGQGLSGYIAPNTSSIVLQGNNGAATGNVSAANFGTTGTIIGVCNYHT